MNTANLNKSTDSTRTHVIMPQEVINQLDTLVGSRGRSRFIVDAVVERLNRIRLQKSAKKVAGSLANTHIPGWGTSTRTTSWVHNLRQEADKRLR